MNPNETPLPTFSEREDARKLIAERFEGRWAFAGIGRDGDILWSAERAGTQSYIRQYGSTLDDLVRAIEEYEAMGLGPAGLVPVADNVASTKTYQRDGRLMKPPPEKTESTTQEVEAKHGDQ